MTESETTPITAQQVGRLCFDHQCNMRSLWGRMIAARTLCTLENKDMTIEEAIQQASRKVAIDLGLPEEQGYSLYLYLKKECSGD